MSLTQFTGPTNERPVVDRLNAARQLDQIQFIELDGSEWSERLDFWSALREALGVVPSHGTGFAAFVDSIFYHPEMLQLPPPFLIMIKRPHPSALADIEEMSSGRVPHGGVGAVGKLPAEATGESLA